MAGNFSALMNLSNWSNGRGAWTASLHKDRPPAGCSSSDNFMVVWRCGEAQQAIRMPAVEPKYNDREYLILPDLRCTLMLLHEGMKSSLFS